MPEEFISVTEASERYGYSDSHIRNLLIKGQIEGEKFASVWMVEAQSLEKYKARMERLGSKKHGLRPTPSASSGQALSKARGPDGSMTTRAAATGGSS